MSPKRCSQRRNDINDTAIAGPDPNLGFRPETTGQVSESKMRIHHSNAFKKEKRHPQAPLSLAPTKDGQDFHPNHRTLASQPTGMGHTVRVSSLHRRSTAQKKPPCTPHHTTVSIGRHLHTKPPPQPTTPSHAG